MAAPRFSISQFCRTALFALSPCIAGVIFVAPANSAEVIGEAVMIRNSVSTKNGDGRGTRRLAVKDPVRGSDTVTAAAQSHGELRLNDDSLVIIGENSSISLDDFVYSGQNNFTTGTVRVAKGAFRFITGDSPKETFKIVTPLSTIGVRGTIFDVYVDGASGNTKVVLFSGMVTVCSGARRCVNTKRACDIIEVSSPQNVGLIPFLRSAQRSRSEEREDFSLSEQQNRFSRRGRAPTVACHARAALEFQDPSSGGDPNFPESGGSNSSSRGIFGGLK